uniref:G patch domain-containing protein 4 n=1 Tax=Catharus ustulatus TaxID=91951 RepID=A0A8C3U3Z2_CATUS
MSLCPGPHVPLSLSPCPAPSPRARPAPGAFSAPPLAHAHSPCQAPRPRAAVPGHSGRYRDTPRLSETRRDPPSRRAMSAPVPPGRGMLFAETQLRRHGWRRGQGLGRRQDGIAEAIRVKVKCDTAGVGHDAAEPFTFHWWDHVFNKAAANIAVEAGQDGISVKALSEQGGRISNKKPRKAGSSGSLLYGRFVKVTWSLGAAWPPAHCCCGPQSPLSLVPLSHSPCVSVLQSATLTACGEESITLPTSSESSEEEEKLDLSSVRR